MRRITYWAMSTLTVLVLLFGYHTSTSSQAAAGGQYSVAAPAQTGTGASSSSSSSAPAPTAGSSPSSTAGSSPSSSSTSASAASTTVTGDAADTRWGPVQVRLTVAGGKITAVDVVEYPENNGRDQEINAQAVPVLVSETLKAQSANIDMVSGATYTSTGYITSLQSALDQAGL